MEKKSEKHKILAINPGSTSTKVGAFLNEESILDETLSHSNEKIDTFEDIWSQLKFRREAILNLLKESDIAVESLDAVVGRGGLLKSLKGGTYRVNKSMLKDARKNLQGVHISNIGCALAEDIARMANIEAYIVDPVSVDEFNELAYFSGLECIKRKSLSHTLSIHSIVRKVSNERNWDFENRNFVAAHLGGGISICPVKDGRILDANNANSGGPFSPQRAGTLPVQELIDLCFSEEYTRDELKKLTLKEAGLTDYLGTADAREVEEMISNGDNKARTVYRAMAYQISKEIAAMAAVLEGKIDLIIITGGLAKSSLLMEWIKKRTEFVSEITIESEISEMHALAGGVLRVLRNEEEALTYP